MKTSNLLLFVLLAALAQGCSKKENNSSSDSAPAAATTFGSTPFIADTTTGTVPFTPVSKAMMENYVASHPLNNPTNYRVKIAMTNAGDHRYAGQIQLSYEDNGVTHTGVFDAPTGVNESFPSLGTNRDVGKYKSHYNYWYKLGGRTVFSGMFQDSYGAVILIIDSAINLGDAQGMSGTISGSLWFKNFSYSYAPQSPERNCWFVYNGPYDCRSTTIINKSSLEPSDGYRKLGSFSGAVTSDIFQ